MVLFQQPFMSGGFPSMNRAIILVYDDDFTGSDDWTDANSTNITVDTVSDNFKVNYVRNASNDKSVYDLQSLLGSLPANKFVIRVHQWNLSVKGASGDIGAFGLSAGNQTVTWNTAHDEIFFMFGAQGTVDEIGGGVNDGIAMNTALNQVTQAYSTSTDYYLEIIRDEDDVTINFGTNSDFTSPLKTITDTGANSLVGLRYLAFTNFDVGTLGTDINSTVQKIQFYNGVSSV